MADDLAPAYLDHRIRLAQVSAGDELLSRFATTAAKAKPAEGGPAAPATAPQALPDPNAEGSTTGRIAKDIGMGLVETPRAVVKGARDAYTNLLATGDELAQWLKEKSAGTPLRFMNAGVRFDEDGVHWMSPEEASKLPEFKTAGLIPDLGAPKTVTGGLIKGITQFIVGMRGAGKALSAAGVPELTGAAGYSMTALKGAVSNFTAFDPHQQRLSNLIEKFPVLQNPVTQYLASDPSDGAAEGRFKNALEGVGLGLITDGFFKGVRMLRDANVAKKATQEASTAADAAAAANAPRQLPEDAFKDLGSEAPTAPLVKLQQSKAGLADVTDAAGAQGAPESAASSTAGRAAEPPKAFINFARIDAPEDVQRVMQRLADLGTPAADGAKAGARGFEAVKLDAAHEDAWNILVNRRAGEVLTDSQTFAARELWAATTDKVTQLAEAAAASPSEANLFAFRKMLDVHDLVQREVLGARASAARSLGSWRIPAGGPAERLRDVAAVLDQHGGSETSQLLAQRISALGKAGMIQEMAAVAEKGAYATSRDAVLEAWVNGLLSNPTTHAANTLSNTSVTFLRMMERGTAAKISSLLGDEGGVAAGEATSQWFGLTQGLKDAFRFAAKSARTGQSGFGLGKLETAHEGAITSEAFNLSSDTALGRGVDLLGGLARVPGRALTAEDEFFKTIGYRMELNAQALRQATSEMPDAADDALKARISEIIANPPENIRMAAVDSATYQTFTNAPGEMAKALGRLTNHYPALKVILPFTRTPANIMRFTFERTPLAPLMKQFRANVAAGGARRDLALAQTALGTAGMLAFADATLSGQISGRGPVEKGQKEAMMREGWKPYSFKIGNRWESYNRLDPIGSLIGMSADATEMMMQAQHDSLDDPDTEKLVTAGALAFAGNITNKSYLSGLSSVIEALNDPQRSAEAWSQRLVGSIVPAGVAGVARLEDPTVREVNSMMDAIRARTPGLSDKLPPRLDLWGEPITTASGLGKPFDAMSPVYSQKPTPEPIDKELLRLESNVTMPPRRTSFNGVTIDLGQYPKAYSRYVELAGNELKHPAWGLGAKDFLNDVVTDKSPMSAIYNLRTDGPDGGKDVFIRDTIRDYREMARRQLLEEFPDLQRAVSEKQTRQRELAVQALGGGG